MWSANQLTYCSNLHPGEDLNTILANIARFFVPVKNARGLPTMYSGLWLSSDAAQQLQQHYALERFRKTLEQQGVLLTSLNGFPYGHFHQESVKTSVYSPDWSDRKRLEYSQHLANILATCLPAEATTGVISSLPLGYQPNWCPEKHQEAIKQLLSLNDFLAELFQRTGKRILVCLEMEPDCVLESTTQLIHFFEELKNANGSAPNYLGVCFDVCHQGVMFENCYESLQRITQAGITIGKIQMSNAIHVDVRTLREPNSSLRETLQGFAENRYLHQVKGQTASGQVIACNDLTVALAQLPSPPSLAPSSTPTSPPPNALYETDYWRIHFHVPLNAERFHHSCLSPLHSALKGVIEFLAYHHPQLTKPCPPYLEVETYSWNVLPPTLQPKNENDLIDGIVQEIQWLEQQLSQQGLLTDQAAHA